MTDIKLGADRVDGTRGPILRALLRLAWPIMTGNMAMVLHQVVNTLWLGRVGSDAVAAVAVAFPVMMFMWAMGDGIVLGGSALVARCTGSGEGDKVNLIAGQVFISLVLFYGAVAVIAVPLMHRLIVLLGTPAEIAADATIFIRILLLGMPITELFFAYTFILQGTGDTVTPMKMWSATMLTNMILDPVLILGFAFIPGLGVAGSAISVVACRLIWVIVVISYVRRGTHGVQIGREHLWPDLSILRRMCKVSLPIAGEKMLVGAEQIALVSIVAGFGGPVLAAYGVGQRILSLAIMPSFAAGTAVTALVGQNLGAGKVDRGERSTWLTAGLMLGLLTGLGLAMAAFPGFLIALFNNEAEVVANGISLLRIVGPSMGLLGCFYVFGGAYRALERTLPFFGWVLVSSWVVRVPLAIYLSASMGVTGIWVAMVVANAFGCVAAGIHQKFRCWGPLKNFQGVTVIEPATGP